MKIGVSFQGRQASGGHSIIEGLLRFCEENEGKLYGFIGGSIGILNQDFIEVT